MLSDSSVRPVAVEKKFADMIVGDRIRTIAKITNVKSDQKHDIPKWNLVYLFDGSKTIRIFMDDVSTMKIGDYLELEFSVKEGKPWNGTPQLAYDLHYLSKVSETEKIPAPAPQPARKAPPTQQHPSDKVAGFLRKDELKDLPVDQPVQFFTKIRSLSPKDGIRERNRKILLVDQVPVRRMPPHGEELNPLRPYGFLENDVHKGIAKRG